MNFFSDISFRFVTQVHLISIFLKFTCVFKGLKKKKEKEIGDKEAVSPSGLPQDAIFEMVR